MCSPKVHLGTQVLGLYLLLMDSRFRVSLKDQIIDAFSDSGLLTNESVDF